MSSESRHIVRLAECASFQEGYVNPSQTVPSYFGDAVKWLRATDLNNGFVFETGRRLSKEGFESAGKSATLFAPGTLAISKSGTIGRIGILQDYMCGNRAVINIKPNPDCDTRFIFYTLLLSRPQIEILAEGSVQKNLYVSTLGNLKIEIPSLAEQKEISSVLGALDDRIALLRETNATLEAIAQALFKSWFVDFDPVRAKMEGRTPEGMDEATAALFPDGFEESALGLVPRGWRAGTLADLADLNPESWTARNQPTHIAYVDLANTKDNEMTSVTNYAFDEAPSRARRVLRTGDTLVGTVRPGNRSFAFIHEPVENLTGSTGFAVLRPSAVENTDFVFLAATQDASIEHLAHVADGGAYPAVRPDVVAGLQCVVPNAIVLRRFHDVTESLLSTVSANQKQAQTLATLRDTLLPRLISGALRLPEVTVKLEESTA